MRGCHYVIKHQWGMYKVGIHQVKDQRRFTSSPHIKHHSASSLITSNGPSISFGHEVLDTAEILHKVAFAFALWPWSQHTLFGPQRCPANKTGEHLLREVALEIGYKGKAFSFRLGNRILALQLARNKVLGSCRWSFRWRGIAASILDLKDEAICSEQEAEVVQGFLLRFRV